MTRKIIAAALIAVAACASIHRGNAASVATTLSITLNAPALALVLNPSSSTQACNVPGGTVVSTASILGGDGNPVTFSMTGNTTDFVINASTGVIAVVAGGVVLADCNKSYSNVVTASQP